MTAHDWYEFVERDRYAEGVSGGGDAAGRLLEVQGEAWIAHAKLNDLLPRTVLQRLGEIVADWVIPQRQRLSRQRWAMLASEAIRCRRTLGVIEIKSGGLPALARRFDNWPFSTLAQNLALWEKAGLVRRWHEPTEVQGPPPVAAVEIPRLTECLVWLARQRAEALQDLPGALSDKQAYFLTYDAIERKAFPPPIPYPSDWDTATPHRRATAAIGAIKAWRDGQGRHPFE
jgi:hypothetical protein